MDAAAIGLLSPEAAMFGSGQMPCRAMRDSSIPDCRTPPKGIEWQGAAENQYGAQASSAR
jgi:hypothetical protein